MKSLSTNELVAEIIKYKGKMYEVAIVKNSFRATHFIHFGGKLIYDTGIDSQEIKWDPPEFLANYRSTYWQIDQVI